MSTTNLEHRIAYEPVPEEVPPLASDVAARYILPDDRTVVPGPSNQVCHDPSLLWACTRSRNVLILDPKGNGPIGDLPYYSLNAWSGAHYANAEQHRDELIAFQSLGIPLVIPRWLGPRCVVQKSGLEDGSVDSILDHGVTGYIARKHSTSTRMDRNSRRIDGIRSIFAEYARILAPGGRLVLQLSDSNIGFQSLLENQMQVRNLLSEYGFSATHQRVLDRYPIPLSEEQVCSIFENADEWHQKTSLGLSYRYMQEREGQWYLTFIPMYYSPDLYVGIKKG